MIEHVLKTDPEVFQSSWDGIKGFELRNNDRDFRSSDRLRLLETVHSGADMATGKPLEYTGRGIEAVVDYVLHGPIYGLSEGWVILSISIEDYGDEYNDTPDDCRDR